ncbi:hypothetical protein ASD02_11160 [Ensifer sp. Root1252]|nr:hypothetical protein ASD02_11160 [Ensifer sp. Root1252]KRC74692.1 hypothetical protein ASE32_07245 [Ensifer sp. Root231]KRC94778.1 hypothetical protein ASE47_08235 [Ensifer sp. Root258]
MFIDTAGQADSAWFCHSLQTHGDVDTVSEEIVAINQDVTEIDADAKLHLVVLGKIERALSQIVLNIDRSPHCLDRTGEFRQHAVACPCEYPTAMFGD